MSVSPATESPSWAATKQPITATQDVAVLIVNYRSAPLTIDTLISLSKERERNEVPIRAIVVDNASGDIPELELAVGERGWEEWVELVAAPRNGGFAYGNNLAIARANAYRPPSYIYLLNPDTQVRPGAIGRLVSFLEHHPQAGIAGSGFENADGSDWPMAFRFPTLASEVIDGLEFGLVTWLLKKWQVPRWMDKTTQQVDWVCGASMMIRPSVFGAIGGLDENYFLYFEETDFCRRARDAGFETWYVPSSRVMHIGGGTTQISERNETPKRLPSYWFDSRRRYFATGFGVSYTMMIDAVALLAYGLGWLKRIALRRTHKAVPHFARDLIRSSIIWPRNRAVPPVRCSISHPGNSPTVPA